MAKEFYHICPTCKTKHKVDLKEGGEVWVEDSESN